MSKLSMAGKSPDQHQTASFIYSLLAARPTNEQVLFQILRFKIITILAGTREGWGVRIRKAVDTLSTQGVRFQPTF